MKLKHLIPGLSILLCASSLLGQSQRVGSLIFPFLPMECQSNVVVTADLEHPKPCPPEFTNLLSNVKLFSVAEQKKLEAVILKYKNVTTNFGPSGSVFQSLSLRQREAPQLLGTSTWVEVTNTFLVACFVYTNSDAKEELVTFPGGETDARFRTRAGDGYDVLLYNDLIVKYQEYKNGVLDGLFVEINDPNDPDGQGHCTNWARFAKGRIIGKYIMWQDGQIEIMAEFQKPFDFLKYQTQKMDLSWNEVSTNTR